MVDGMSDASIDTQELGEAQMKLWQDSLKLWASSGVADDSAESVISPVKGDRRFRSGKME